MEPSYHQELYDTISSRNRLQFALENSLEEARTMLTQVRQQHGMAGDHENCQASTMYHLLRPQRSSSMFAPLRLEELVAVHAHGSWMKVKIMGQGLEGDN